MTTNNDEVSNLDFPISHSIRAALHDLPIAKQVQILNGLTSEEFISLRVDVYLHEIESAMHAGYDEAGAKEIALKECLTGIDDSHGAVLED